MVTQLVGGGARLPPWAPGSISYSVTQTGHKCTDRAKWGQGGAVGAVLGGDIHANQEMRGTDMGRWHVS